MQRRRLTRAQKVRIFDAARGLCHICQTKIPTGIYPSLVHPHGMLRPVSGGYVITTEYRTEIGQKMDGDILEAAE